MPIDENAPKLRVLRGGDIMVSDPDIRRFSPSGELKRARAVSRSRYPDSVASNPGTVGGFRPTVGGLSVRYRKETG
jgi:hypothetical protein